MQTEWNGIYRAVVVSTNDPTNKGRIRVKVPQVSGNAEINWAESVNPALPTPTVNSVVWVMFNGGYINKPVFFSNTSDSESWHTPALSSGYTHNGNSNGTVQYTKYSERGNTYIEWRGGLNVASTGSAGSYVNPNSGTFCTLSSSYCPPINTLRSISTAQNYFGGTNNTAKIDFKPDGSCTLIGSASVQTVWVSLHNIRYTI